MQIGDRVTHRLNGFTGIITATTEYLNGCRQHLVQPEKLDPAGKIQDGAWIDEQYWEVEAEQVMPNPFADGAAPLVGGPDRTSRPTK